MTALKVGALFAGYGGLELGLAQVLDVETAWVADCCHFTKGGEAGHTEPHGAPCSILAHRYPGAPNLGDVTKVDWASVEPVDIITGGSPCQDLSHAGKRAGMKAGTRSGLWASMCDAIDIIRPRLVVWENVQGALSARADSAVEPCPICLGDDPGVTLRALGRVLGDLAELGYDARWYGLRAADVGAAHGRFRVFVIAHPAADGDSQGLQERRDQGVFRAAAPEAPAAADGDRGARAGLTLLPTPAVNDMGEGKTVEAWDAWTAKMRAAHGNGNGHGKSLAIEAQRLAGDVPLFPTPRTSDTNGAGAHGSGGPDLGTVVGLLPTPRATRGGSATETTMLLPTPTSTDAKASGSHGYGGNDFCTLTDATVRLPERWGNYAPAIARWETVIGRPAPDPTEPAPKGGRRLSARFVEWLMGLPDGWVTDVPGITRNQALKALGNGIVPQQCAAALAAYIRDENEERAA